MVALARPISGDEARSLGLIDALGDGDPLAAAGRLLGAWEVARRGRDGAPDLIDLQARFFLVRRMLRDMAANQMAPLSAVRAMEAAVQMRPRQARAEVDRIADELAQSQQGGALRHAAGALAGLTDRFGDLGQAPARTVQRLWWPMAREAIHLLDEGASPAQVDRCFTDFGFPVGPFAKSDTRGFEAVFTAGDDALAAGGDWVLYSPTLDLMADAGRVGGDTLGWYRPTTATSRTRFEPVVDLLVQSSAISQRLRRAPISDEAVMRRCLNAAVNAAFAECSAREGLTLDDIDALWIGALDFPRWRGGLVYHARARGLDVVVAELGAAAARRDTAGAPCDGLIAAANASEPPRSVAVGDRG